MHPSIRRVNHNAGIFRRYTTSHVRSPGRLLLASFCILLVLLAGTLSVTHSHPDGAVHADCGLCVVAHATAQTVAASPVVLSVPIFLDLETPEPISRAQATVHFRLYSRPPPADSHRS
jgi:hypothetical protein